MFMSNMMPYLGPSIKILCRRGCCCCKRQRYRPRTHLNEEYPMVRRYAFILKTMFTCFTYGFAIPMLWIVAFFILIL